MPDKTGVGVDVRVGVSAPSVDLGRSRISLTEKLLDLGILIESNLENY